MRDETVSQTAEPLPNSKPASRDAARAAPNSIRSASEPAARPTPPRSSWPRASSSSSICARRKGNSNAISRSAAGHWPTAAPSLTSGRRALRAGRAQHPDGRIGQWPSCILRKEVLLAANVDKINRREQSRRKRTSSPQEAAAQPRRGSQARRQAARQGTGRRRSAARADDAGRSAARGLRHRAGRARAGAVAPRSSQHARRSTPRSPICGRKINSIGGVNLDALAELEELEARFGNLSSQHTDLSAAKNSLEADHRQDQRRQPAAVRRNAGRGARALSDAVSQAVRRRPGRHRARRGGRHSGERHRDRRPPARQGAAQHLAARAAARRR